MNDKISIQDFQKMDIRIGTIMEAKVPDWSHWVMKLTVDLGDLPEGVGIRTIFAGIMHHYKPEALEGKQSLFVVNLEDKKIGPKGDFSQGMMLMGIGKLEKPIKVESEEIDEEPTLLSPAKKVPNGTKVQ